MLPYASDSRRKTGTARALYTHIGAHFFEPNVSPNSRNSDERDKGCKIPGRNHAHHSNFCRPCPSSLGNEKERCSGYCIFREPTLTQYGATCDRSMEKADGQHRRSPCRTYWLGALIRATDYIRTRSKEGMTGIFNVQSDERRRSKRPSRGAKGRVVVRAHHDTGFSRTVLTGTGNPIACNSILVSPVLWPRTF